MNNLLLVPGGCVVGKVRSKDVANLFWTRIKPTSRENNKQKQPNVVKAEGDLGDIRRRNYTHFRKFQHNSAREYNQLLDTQK